MDRLGGDYLYARGDPLSLVDANGLSVSPDRVLSRSVAMAQIEKTVARKGADIEGALESLFYKFFPGGSSKGGNRFVFTCVCGWIDLGHFFGYAEQGYNLSAETGLAISVLMEIDQAYSSRLTGGWHESAFTAEDLSTNLLGSLVGNTLQNTSDVAAVTGAVGWLLDRCEAVPRGKLRHVAYSEAQRLEKSLAQNKQFYPYRGKAWCVECTDCCCDGSSEDKDCLDTHRAEDDEKFAAIVGNLATEIVIRRGKWPDQLDPAKLEVQMGKNLLKKYNESAPGRRATKQ